MVSLPERRALRDWVALDWTGGDIVEIGAFAGASAVAILQGMEAASRPGQLHVYDTFEMPADRGIEAIYRQLVDAKSFLEPFLANTAPWSHRVSVAVGKAEVAGQVPERISLLHLDCAISKGFHRDVSLRFFPRLEVGATLIQQDFDYEPAPYIKVAMQRLVRSLEPVNHVGTSRYFVVRAPLEPAAIEEAFA